MQRFARVALASKFVPDHITTIEKAIMIIQAGKEIGLAPWASMNKIAMINGSLSVYGEAAMGLCQSSPKWCEMSHREWFTGDDDAFIAHCQMGRVGGQPHEATYSVADARRAGLWGMVSRSGKAMPWMTDPKGMSMWRARHRVMKAKFSDVLMGMSMREISNDFIDIRQPSSQPQVSQSAIDTVNQALAEIPATVEAAG